MSTDWTILWAKTYIDSAGQEALGISTPDHCTNVGFVAAAIVPLLPPQVRSLLPGDNGSATPVLTALHDIGKITIGFLIKSSAWRIPASFDERTVREAAFSESDHALVSQLFLQNRLKGTKSSLWAAAVGAHHGRPKGRMAKPRSPEAASEWAAALREVVTEYLIQTFGPLPDRPPDPRFGLAHSDLWLLAGLITVADWVGSNEAFFPASHGLPPEASKLRARQAIAAIGWPGGVLRPTSFAKAFTGAETESFRPNTVQSATANLRPGLVIIEAPMGSGKTEAALYLAQQWISKGHHHGLYFALPTQVTSNRIHLRIGEFLRNTLEESARLRLAHGHAWLEEDYHLELHPTCRQANQNDDSNPFSQVREARSWFASAKHALLAPYGVGTIDQALQAMVAVKHFFVRRFALAGKVVILDEIHSYDIYTGTLVGALVGELLNLGCSVIILSATLTAARRRELLEAAGCKETESPAAYPLISHAASTAQVQHLVPEWNQEKEIRVRAGNLGETEVTEELIQRAEAGQHVLWIRNTVIEAQAAFATVRSQLREGAIKTGLLHSRFPFIRRQELESDWLEHLGRNRAPNGPGSILIATQVVEQSVDIDLDFIVSDLAPTDMLIQRAGRLWRHPRPAEHRAANQPEFWIKIPDVSASESAKHLRAALGRSAHVYAPYALLRSASVWRDLTDLKLPGDIRPLLEATYALPSESEPPTWQELARDLDSEIDRLRTNAQATMQVLGGLMLPDEDERTLTRRKSAPTTPLLILSSVAPVPGQSAFQLKAPDGSASLVSEFEWSLNAARFIHRWMVRVPRWMVPRDVSRPRWLMEHASEDAAFALLREDGGLAFGEDNSSLSYHPDCGIYSRPKANTHFQSRTWNDDDEFDQ